MAQKHSAQIFLAPLLYPVSLIYGFISRFRRFLYKANIKKSYVPRIPCFCVGNISWGGTGKSPVIDYLLKYLHKHEKNCAVLTRGYGVKLPAYPFVLDKNTKTDTLNLPDEPCMLLQKNPFATVLIDPKRAESAQFAEQNLPHIQALLMDDGFQHFALARDVNFVLLDKDDLTPKNHSSFKNNNWNTLIPLGSWREPETALHRADVFLLKCPQNEWQELKTHTQKLLAPYGKALFVFEIRLEKLVPLFHDTVNPFSRYTLLAGIGNPSQFQKSTENFLSAPCSQHFFLQDHADMQTVVPKLLKIDMPVVCTEKDAVKLQHFNVLSAKEIYYTQSSVRFHACLFTAENFDTWLDKNILTKFN